MLPLQSALLDALRSPILGAENFLDIISLCHVIYKPVDSYPLKLKLPQYWHVVKLDEGTVRFRQTGRYRTKPVTKLQDYSSRQPGLKLIAKRVLPLEPIDTLQPITIAEPDFKRPRTTPLEDKPVIANEGKLIVKLKPSTKINLKPPPAATTQRASGSPQAARTTPSMQRMKELIITLKLSPRRLHTFPPGEVLPTKPRSRASSPRTASRDTPAPTAQQLHSSQSIPKNDPPQNGTSFPIIKQEATTSQVQSPPPPLKPVVTSVPSEEKEKEKKSGGFKLKISLSKKG